MLSSRNFIKNENNISKLMSIAKAVQRERLIVINAYIKKEERAEINNSIPEETRERTIMLTVNRRQEIMKVGTEINKIEN